MVVCRGGKKTGEMQSSYGEAGVVSVRQVSWRSTHCTGGSRLRCGRQKGALGGISPKGGSTYGRRDWGLLRLTNLGKGGKTSPPLKKSGPTEWAEKPLIRSAEVEDKSRNSASATGRGGMVARGVSGLKISEPPEEPERKRRPTNVIKAHLKRKGNYMRGDAKTEMKTNRHRGIHPFSDVKVTAGGSNKRAPLFQRHRRRYDPQEGKLQLIEE